eukprot:TRINITY_DN1231_c0_g2_i1.p1 TRINITY_DN1231_c0_g2~~TRINITY_DN1231_c0_g2_i1.p1  ORF type:complete len:953 (-),score=177.05 TRINITY_DN1231_c0_g2_i1:86-2944(-)
MASTTTPSTQHHLQSDNDSESTTTTTHNTSKSKGRRNHHRRRPKIVLPPHVRYDTANTLNDVIVQGWMAHDKRSFTVRPKTRGTYFFCCWPAKQSKQHIKQDSATKYSHMANKIQRDMLESSDSNSNSGNGDLMLNSQLEMSMTEEQQQRSAVDSNSYTSFPFVQLDFKRDDCPPKLIVFELDSQRHRHAALRLVQPKQYVSELNSLVKEEIAEQFGNESLSSKQQKKLQQKQKKPTKKQARQNRNEDYQRAKSELRDDLGSPESSDGAYGHLDLTTSLGEPLTADLQHARLEWRWRLVRWDVKIEGMPARSTLLRLALEPPENQHAHLLMRENSVRKDSLLDRKRAVPGELQHANPWTSLEEQIDNCTRPDACGRIQFTELMRERAIQNLATTSTSVGEEEGEDGKKRLSPDDIVEARTIVWSCNRPYVDAEVQTKHRTRAKRKLHLDRSDEPREDEVQDRHGRVMPAVAVGPGVLQLFDWFRQQVFDFNPDTIWGNGDTAYSDGPSSADFAKPYYTGQVNIPEDERDIAAAHVTSMYRRMFRYHWSFGALQDIMRSVPHVMQWDDHEIRDGWGSEEIESASIGGATAFAGARRAAEEFELSVGPRLRMAPWSEAHKGYLSAGGLQASFLFDTRTHRNYTHGRLASLQQMHDFTNFCHHIAQDPRVHFLLLGTTVPLIYLKPWVSSRLPRFTKRVSDMIGGLRDDARDSWVSPNNLDVALPSLLDVLLILHKLRPDIRILNISGDIHVANAFHCKPPGFTRRIYQVTTSALTNSTHIPPKLARIAVVGKSARYPHLGKVTRIWEDVTERNFLAITTTAGHVDLDLRVFDPDDKRAEVTNTPSLRIKYTPLSPEEQQARSFPTTTSSVYEPSPSSVAEQQYTTEVGLNTSMAQSRPLVADDVYTDSKSKGKERVTEESLTRVALTESNDSSFNADSYQDDENDQQQRPIPLV